MKDDTAPVARPPMTFERSYEAPVEDLWELWTTPEGLESWWGPEGFRIEVHKLELRVGGELHYDMIADGAEQIAYMKRAGQPLVHKTHGTFVEITPLSRLRIRYVIDFLPGVEPYDNDVLVELIPDGGRVRMVITVDQHRADELTRLARAGWESQLTKVPAALAGRAKRSTRVRRHVRAPRARVYRALLDAREIAAWKVPAGMTSHVHELDAREGGAFRVSLTYDAPDRTGKTSGRTDTYHGRFAKLVPNEQVVEVSEFETEDPAMRGEMTVTLTLADAEGGTEIVAAHEGLPPGVALADNELGWRQALDRLAALVEAS